MSNEKLFTPTEEAAMIVATLSEETRVEVGAMLLRELARHERETHPLTADAIANDDPEDTREVFFTLIRESEAERDHEVLALMAAWFVERASKQDLCSLLFFIEHNEGSDEDDPDAMEANY